MTVITLLKYRVWKYRGISFFHCYNAVALAYIKVLFGLLLIFTIICCGSISKVCCKCLRLKLRCIHGLFRSTWENYGDAAIGYVELKRKALKCVVKDGYVQNTGYEHILMLHYILLLLLLFFCLPDIGKCDVLHNILISSIHPSIYT
jgi:hypothetical protein